jgi:hypothetical protein
MNVMGADGIMSAARESRLPDCGWMTGNTDVSPSRSPHWRPNVVDFVAVRAQAIYKDQQTRDRGSGEIQFKALKSCEFQQASINPFTCFGSRGVDLC